MKQLFAFFTVGLLSSPLAAQNAWGCNATRYLTQVFADTTTTTVVYGSTSNGQGQNIQLSMTIVQPKNDTLTRRPVVVWAFGGGFVTGQRADMLPFCQDYARRGYVCATIDYRIDPTIAIPPIDSQKVMRAIINAMHDMKAAVRFLRKNAATYQIDPNNILAGGISAGAITSMLVGQLDSTDVAQPWLRSIITNAGGFEGNSGNPGFSSAVKGVNNMSGALYLGEWLDAGDVPFVSYHGTADNVVAYGYGTNVYGFYGAGSGVLHPRALQLGIPTVLVTVQGGGHGDIYALSGTYAAQYNTFLTKMVVFDQRLICGLAPLPTQEMDNQSVKVYPNPAENDITVELPNTEARSYNVTVFDMTGREVFAAKNLSAHSFVLSKQKIGAGMFIAQIRFNDTQEVFLKKIQFSH